MQDKHFRPGLAYIAGRMFYRKPLSLYEERLSMLRRSYNYYKRRNENGEYDDRLMRLSLNIENLQIRLNAGKKLSRELVKSKYDTLDKRYIKGRIVNVSYHEPDWYKCFHPEMTDAELRARTKNGGVK